MKFTKEENKFIKTAKTVDTVHTHTHIVLKDRKITQDLRSKIFVRRQVM